MKASPDDHIDQITNLPVNVIDGILEHLPIRDVVRTSILSRKWRYMWISVPRLEFGLDFFWDCYGRNIEHPEIHSIITKVLSLHNDPVSSFTLRIPYSFSSQSTYFSKWILSLSKSSIKYLELLSFGRHYEMPSHLFSCQGLTYLKLCYFKLSLPLDFRGFKNLLELHLLFIGFECGALERLISGCPALNVLTISLCSGFDSIHVPIPSLKVLCIESRQDMKSICFKKAENLTDVTLIMGNHGGNFEHVSDSDLISGLPEIERLCLRKSGDTKILSIGINMQTLQKSINSLKYLELDGVDFTQSSEISCIVSLLESSSILVELVIKSSSVAEAPVPDHLRVLHCNRYCLSQLRKVNITVGTAYEHALDFIRFLLANSSSLEILTFKVGLGLKQSDTPTLLSISQDLSQMGRASQRAEVKFLHKDETS